MIKVHAMPFLISQLTSLDTRDARRLVLDHFFVLRRQRVMSDVVRNPHVHAVLVLLTMSTCILTYSVRFSGVIAALGLLIVSLICRLLCYVVESFKHRDMFSDDEFASYWLQDDKERRMCLVKDDGTGLLVGLAGLSKENENVAELKWIVVHNGYRRRGIARLLLNCVLNDYAREMKAVTV